MDGFDDIVAIGTIYDTEVETPRLDMGSGTVLLSNGKDGFDYDTELNRKIRFPGNLKSIEKIMIGEEPHLLVGRNSEMPLIVPLNQLNSIQ